MNRRAPTTIVPAVSAIAVLLSGCSFLTDRGRDAGDSVRGRIALGIGLYAEAEATSLLRPAVGFADATLAPKLSWEHEPRATHGTGEVRTAAFPALVIGWPLYGLGETREGYGDTQPYLRGFFAPWVLMGNYHVDHRTVGVLWLDRLLPNPRLEPEPNEAPPPRGSAVQEHGWFGASATLLFVRLDLGLNPVELVDCLTGFVGWDLLDDDDDRVPDAHSDDLDSDDPNLNDAQESR